MLFDQLEEVLVLNPADRQAQTEFFRQVGAAQDTRPVGHVLDPRGLHGGLDRYTRHLPTGLRARYRLDFLERRAALQAIREPARARGVEVEEEAATLLFDDLRTITCSPRARRGPSGSRARTSSRSTCRSCATGCGGGCAPTPMRRRTVITAEQVTPYLDVAGALGAYYADAVAETVRKTGADERVLRDWFETHLITAQSFRAQTRTGPAVDAASTLRTCWCASNGAISSAAIPGRAHRTSHPHRLVDPGSRTTPAWREEHLAAWQQAGRPLGGSGRKAEYLLADAEVRAARAGSPRAPRPDPGRGR